MEVVGAVRVMPTLPSTCDIKKSSTRSIGDWSQMCWLVSLLAFEVRGVL